MQCLRGANQRLCVVENPKRTEIAAFRVVQLYTASHRVIHCSRLPSAYVRVSFREEEPVFWFFSMPSNCDKCGEDTSHTGGQCLNFLCFHRYNPRARHAKKNSVRSSNVVSASNQEGSYRGYPRPANPRSVSVPPMQRQAMANSVARRGMPEQQMVTMQQKQHQKPRRSEIPLNRLENKPCPTCQNPVPDTALCGFQVNYCSPACIARKVADARKANAAALQAEADRRGWDQAWADAIAKASLNR